MGHPLKSAGYSPLHLQQMVDYSGVLSVAFNSAGCVDTISRSKSGVLARVALGIILFGAVLLPLDFAAGI